MAVYPCDYSQHRYAGPQRTAYVTVVFGTEKPTTTRSRLCPAHFDELEQRCASIMELIGEETSVSTDLSCHDKGCPNRRAGAVYAKLFPGGDDYREWVGDFCAPHLEAAVDVVLSGRLRAA